MSDNQSNDAEAWEPIPEVFRLVEARAAIAQQPAKRDDGMPISADERKLRRMYCARVGIPGTYMDDGEAHGTEHGIQIDFMREPVADIAAKVMALEVARYECRQGAAIAQPAEPKKQTFTRAELIAAIEAERHACSIAVWMALQDALADDADDKGLDGWMREAEQRIKNRSTNDPEVAQADAQPAEPLIRGLSGKCSRSVCECERDGLGNQCIWLEPTDAELGRRTGEPHVDGYPLFSGIPPGAQPATVKESLTHAQAESSGLPRAIQWGALYSAACGVTAKLGKDGSIQTDDAAVDSLMNALHALDGGQWMPGLMPGPTIQPAGERAE